MHGWGGSTASFEGVARSLDGFRVTLVDFYGFGKTPHPDYPLFIDDYAQSIVKLIAKYRMTRVTLVGHSFGCRVALRIASKYGYLIDNMVLADGAGIRPRRTLKYYFKVYRHKLLNKLHISHTAGSADYRELSGVMKQTFVNIVNEDQSGELEKITVPALLFWGDKDKDTPIYMAKRIYRKVRGSGLIVVRGAGHFAYLEAMPLFIQVLTQFISGGDYEVGDGGFNNNSGRRGIVKISLPKSR